MGFTAFAFYLFIHSKNTPIILSAIEGGSPKIVLRMTMRENLADKQYSAKIITNQQSTINNYQSTISN